MNPLVSIIIPAYNSEKYIAETIESALAQTWSNKEIIVINDGSADGTAAVLNRFCDKITIEMMTQNKGAAAARNRGLEIASGDYIQFLDADDLLSPDKITQQVTLLENKPRHLAICSTVHFADNDVRQNLLPSEYEEQFLFSDNDPTHFLLNLYGAFSAHGSMIPVHSWLSPKEIINKVGKWDEALGLDDDGEFFCRMMLNSSGIIKTDGFCYYRKYINRGSLSAQSSLAAFTSKLNATLSKKRHILSKNNSYKAQTVIYKALINIAAENYLKYPSIYKRAISELPQIRINYTPVLGGKITTVLIGCFGWRFVKRLKAFLNLFKK